MKLKTPEIKTRTDGSEYISMRNDQNGSYLSYIDVRHLFDEPDADKTYSAEEIDALLISMKPVLIKTQTMTTWKSMRLKNLEMIASNVLVSPFKFKPEDVFMLRSIIGYVEKHHRLPIES